MAKAARPAASDVSDLVDGLLPSRLRPNEISILELAETILRLTGSESALEFRPMPQDDPANRRPDISKAGELLGWAPQVSLIDGLEKAIAWQRSLAAAHA
jgi:nucleoside-diphosphate-sugar epimerase